MTVTLSLPPDVERVFQGEAQARGLSLDEFLSDLIVSQAEEVSGQSVAAPSARLEYERGVPVLRTDQPVATSVVDELRDHVRRERSRAISGLLDLRDRHV